ncbi:hypothetical protein CN941_30220 [Bacillus cereus]|nr:hypothetical protein CN527_18550 [Bacillus cereus]PFE68192.1 hypothetical protein CN316_17905 [Bacillus cereus]PFJ03694.1 hypothetical protein COI88_17975 [Bacillus cereus]PGL38954.1 hypothetical protein CN930_12605 [Bacillus cereus]PGM28620.1 hypothetical protein CN941_30220 [Bacillus cereus]
MLEGNLLNLTTEVENSRDAVSLVTKWKPIFLYDFYYIWLLSGTHTSPPLYNMWGLERASQGLSPLNSHRKVANESNCKSLAIQGNNTSSTYELTLLM